MPETPLVNPTGAPAVEPAPAPAELALLAPDHVRTFFYRDPTSREVFRVGQDQAAILERSGFIPVSGPDAVEPSAEFEGPLETLKAIAEGALGTLAPIAGPAAEAALLGNKREQLGRAEAHPIAHGLVGPVAAILGTAGLGALGAGAKGVGLAAEGLSAASRLAAPSIFEAAGRAVGGAVAKRVGEGALARMTAAAANQGAQGALYGLADAANRLTLGDDLTAEQVMREGGTGLVFGGAIGALGSGTASMLRGLVGGVGRATEAAGVALSSADKGTAEILIANRGVVKAIDKAVPGAAKMLDGASPDVADFILKNGAKVIKADENFPGLVDILSRAPDAQTAEQVMGRWGKLLTTTAEREAAGVEWQNLLTDTAKKMRESGIHHSVEWRPKEIRELAGGAVTAQTPGGETVFFVPRASAEDAANLVINTLDQTIKTGRARPVDYHGPTISDFEKISGQMEDQLFSGKYPQVTAEELAQPPRYILRPDRTPEDVYNYLVDVRRQAERKLPFDAAAPISDHVASRTKSLMNDLRMQVREVLHDRGTWEKLADVQKAYDAAKSAQIDAEETFNKLFLDKHTGEATAKKVDGWLKLVAEGRGRDYTKSLQDYFAASKNYADVMASSGMAEGPGVRKMIESVEQKFGEALAQGHVTQIVENIASRGGTPAQGTPGWQQAAVVAARASGVHGVGTALSALNRLRSPSTVAGALSAIDAVKAAFNTALDSHVARLFGSAAAAATPAVAAPTKITPQNYQQVSRVISNMAGAPDVTAQTLESRFAPASVVDPSWMLKMHGKAQGTAVHLKAQMPKPTKVGALDPAYRPSGSELRTLNQHVEIAQDPLQVLALARRGALTDAHVQALDATAPKIANEIRLAVASRIAENPGAVKKLSRPAQASLSHLLGYDLSWGHSALAIGGTQALYKSMGTPQRAGQVGEKVRGNVDVAAGNRYSTATENVNKSLGRV